jgi:hypothetical protein
MDDYSKTFKVSGFDKLELGSAFNIVVTKGEFSVKVSGRQEDVDELEANVSGGKLRITYKNKSWSRNNHKSIDIEISMPTLRGLDLSGASRSKISGFDNLSALDLTISGASTSEINVVAQKISLNFSGASTITLIGSGGRIEGELSGATTFRGYDFKAKEAHLEVSGASNAKVMATERLEIEASGASSVRYRGTASVKANTSGASSIRSES